MIKESKYSSTQYVSCIKINGCPILPPLITVERRKELQLIKQRAIAVEEKLRNRQILKSNLEEIVCRQRWLEETQSKFDDERAELLESIEPKFDDYSSELMREIDYNTYSDFNRKSAKSNAVCLTQDTIDVTQYNDDGITIINPHKIPQLTITEQTISSESIPSKPRLLRSNSYTLDCPSPILLAHIEKENPDKVTKRNSCTSNYIPFEQYASTPKEKPEVPLIHTDVSVKKFSITAPIMLLTDPKEQTENSDTFDDQIERILQNVPEAYSRKIRHFIDEQKKVEEKVTISPTADEILFLRNRSNSAEKSYRESNDLLSMSSQSLYYTITPNSSDSTTTQRSKTPIKLVDLESDVEEEKTGSQPDVSGENRNSIVSRQLFPRLDGAGSKRVKEEWAASVIGAYVKGYFVRRLLKTEKVQTLIQTIKDALLCALQLHNADHIDESDVELHRRLIQQVSAACYAFHDIFFKLTIPEQMTVISTDRHRKLEKANRPASAPSRRLTPTARQQRSISIRSSQSLTKV